jgi:ATP-binding cassette subfamily B protein
MFSFYWKLALVTLGVLPCYALIYFISDRLNKKAQRKVMEKAADLEGHLVESLNAAGTIKRFGLEEFSNNKIEKRFGSLLGELYRSGLNSVFSSNSTSLVSQLITVIILWAGAVFVINTEITQGELLSFYAVIGYFTIPVTSIMSFNRTLQDARIAADRLFEIFDLTIEDQSGKAELNSATTGDIRFDKVKFRYGTRTSVFDSLDLTIRKGEITAITGESGSGKTTLISLLQNIYPITQGKIMIGDLDIHDITITSLRKIVAVVPQKIHIFSGSVAENIALGEPDPDMSAISEVCEKLGMMNFISQLPNGFDTYLGENGAALSGGQVQRIAIARALYRKPEILILDEATSSLDPLAEQFVKNTVKYLRSENKTVIIIGHRFSTLSMAHRIIVLQNGEIVQDGSFNELVKSEGQFKKMWEHQLVE